MRPAAFVYSRLKDGRFPVWPKSLESPVSDNSSGGFGMTSAMSIVDRNKKNRTRLSAVGTVILLAAGSLAGCAGGGSQNTNTDTTPPSAPTNLTATAASSTQINLAWTASTDNVGVTGYRVERCQGNGCSSFAQIATPTVTTFNDTSLTLSTSYSYRVQI